MKLNKYLLALGLGAAMFTSCASEWTEPKAEVYENQKDLKRLVPFLEVKNESQMTPTLRKHYEQIAEYRKKDRVLGFGWFGNWTAKGDNPMSYLKALPDSVDMVSIWGTKGQLTQDQQEDLRYFQDYKHGKAMLCWIVQDTGDQITPPQPVPLDPSIKNWAKTYWVDQRGGGDVVKAAEAYADAIADTIVKYRLDGFDIDYEPGYNHHSRWSHISNRRPIGSNDGRGENSVMFAFIKRLYDRFQAETAKDGRKRLIAFDGEPEYLTNEAADMIDYFIFQAYWESNTSAVVNKVKRISNLKNYVRKTLVTVEFEQTWRTGGIHPQSGSANGSGRFTYTSTAYPNLNNKDISAQLLDYATLDIDGVRIGGIGSYHMEYDTKDHPYKFLRMALDRGNKELPGTFNKN